MLSRDTVGPMDTPKTRQPADANLTAAASAVRSIFDPPTPEEQAEADAANAAFKARGLTRVTSFLAQGESGNLYALAHTEQGWQIATVGVLSPL